MIEGTSFISRTNTDSQFSPVLKIQGQLISDTITSSHVDFNTRVNESFLSNTITHSYFSGSFLVIDRFTSKSHTHSWIDGRVRTFKHDPKKYVKSEPIFIYSRDEELQLVLSDVTIPHFDSWIIEQLNGEFRLEFDTIGNNPEVAKIENDGRAVTRNADGSFAEFIIRNIEDNDNINGSFKSVSAEGSDYELIDEFLPEYKQATVGLRTALSAVLQGTRVEVGIVEDFPNQSVNLRNMSVKQAVNELVNLYGGEIRYRVEVQGSYVIRRYIDVLKRRGEARGKRFEAGKDIISSTRNFDSKGIKTALYGRGASDEDGVRLDFSQVEWIKNNGDPVDKPLGQSWVGDEQALSIWGYDNRTRHKFGLYDSQEEDPAELLLNTYNKLKEMTKLRDTYEVEVIQLANLLDAEHEDVLLGDTVRVINREMHPYLEQEASIIEYRHNLNDRRLSDVTLGHFRNAYDLSDRVHDMETDFNDKRGEWDKKPEAEAEKTRGEIGQWVDGKIEAAEQKIRDAEEEIEQANQRIEDAKEKLEQSLEDIEQTKIDLGDAEQAIIDARNNPQNYIGFFDGDVYADNLTLGNRVIAQNAIFTGTIQGSQLTVLNATMETGNIINANIQDATITGSLVSVGGTFTGELIGVDGTFTGELVSVDGTFVGDLVGARIFSQGLSFVGSDLIVTDNLYLGENQLSNDKRIVFSQGARIRGGLGVVGHGLYIEVDELGLRSHEILIGQVTPVRLNPEINFDIPDRGRFKITSYASNNRNNSAEFWIDPQSGNFYLRNNNDNVHVFYNNGTKNGGSIKIDGNRYGMSPIDSPQTLIYDLITDIDINGQATIYLDDLYVKAIENYAVFANNPNVEILEKYNDFFVVEGNGLCDFQVIGSRKDYEGTYFTDMTTMNEEMMAVES